MPFYEYQCQACGEHHEALQKVSEPPLQDCPACGEPQLKKLISAAGFRLKGGGWYETDFKSDKKRNLHDNAGSKSDSASGSKSESKPESAGSKSESSGGGSGGGTAGAGGSGKKAASS